jgi:predicted RNA-binding protein YlxR (DUF448 family)
VACREGKSKRELVRIVRSPDGSVAIDPSGKQAGRGAYLCQASECWNAGIKRSVLAKALKLDALRPDDTQALSAFAEQLAQSTTQAAS